jgi:hypothetical protein
MLLIISLKSVKKAYLKAMQKERKVLRKMKAQILLNNQMSMKQHYNEEFLCRKMI